MSTNEVWVPTATHLERLDLDGQTALLPTFQANDRTRPDTLQSEYTVEFEVPATARNHRLLSHAAASLPAQGGAYKRVMAVLTSDGVETIPLALLYIKGYTEGRFLLQIFGGNIRFADRLKHADGRDKLLSDLNFDRFNHLWTPANIAARLPYAHWQANGYGYELFDRGKPVDLQAVDPYTLYPSVAASLILDQIVSEAGFTADSLLGEPLFAASSVPTANPYTFPQAFRDARALKAGFEYYPAGNTSDGRVSDGQFHESEFGPERLQFEYTTLAPYHAPTAGATYGAGQTYTADTLGYYDLSASVMLRFGSRREARIHGQVSCKVMLYVNGQPVYLNGDQIGKDELRITSGENYQTIVFAPKLDRYLLHPGDTVELWWQGDEWDNSVTGNGPWDPYWQLGPAGSLVTLPGGNILNTQATFTVVLLPEFPQGGLVKLQDWLPAGITQLQFFKSQMLLLGLTIQVDDYRPHLHLAPGSRLLENVYQAPDWTNKRDAAAAPGRQPERNLLFRFGEYAQANYLKWKADESVTPGYGNGSIAVADEVLPTSYDMAELPFAATEASPVVPGLLRILNFERSDITVVPPVYTPVEAEARITLRGSAPVISGQLVISDTALQPFTTTASYFAGVDISLMLNSTVLTKYWADLRAMLDESRYLTERYRLTARDIAELDFSVPIWDGILGDFFAVSRVSEFSAKRPTEVQLVRLNQAYLPPPVVPSEDGQEFYGGEFSEQEFR
jgi:hypothetical protein